MAETSNWKLNLSTYLVSTGLVWTANIEANWAILDAMLDNLMFYEDDILIYEDTMLINTSS